MKTGKNISEMMKKVFDKKYDSFGYKPHFILQKVLQEVSFVYKINFGTIQICYTINLLCLDIFVIFCNYLDDGSDFYFFILLTFFGVEILVQNFH